MQMPDILLERLLLWTAVRKQVVAWKTGDVSHPHKLLFFLSVVLFPG